MCYEIPESRTATLGRLLSGRSARLTANCTTTSGRSASIRRVEKPELDALGEEQLGERGARCDLEGLAQGQQGKTARHGHGRKPQSRLATRRKWYPTMASSMSMMKCRGRLSSVLAHNRQ